MNENHEEVVPTDIVQDDALPVEHVVEQAVSEVAVVEQPQQASPTMTVMQLIERVSQMPELDMDRVDRLFDMHQRMIDREAESAFNAAMAIAQGEIQSVSANRQNDHTKSSYANLSAVHDACKPVWTRYGFSVISTMKPSDQQNHILVSCEVRHSGGFKQVYENDWPLDLAGAKGAVNKTPIQAMGSTGSYARRYTELMIFDIAIKHEDNDGSAPPKDPAMQSLNNAQIKNLRAAMAVAGVGDDYICKKAQINRVEELYQGRLQSLINHLKKLSAQEDSK